MTDFGGRLSRPGQGGKGQGGKEPKFGYQTPWWFRFGIIQLEFIQPTGFCLHKQPPKRSLMQPTLQSNELSGHWEVPIERIGTSQREASQQELPKGNLWTRTSDSLNDIQTFAKEYDKKIDDKWTRCLLICTDRGFTLICWLHQLAVSVFIRRTCPSKNMPF